MIPHLATPSLHNLFKTVDILEHHHNCVPNSPVLLLVLTAASSKSPNRTADKIPRIDQKGSEGPADAQENKTKYKTGVLT